MPLGELATWHRRHFLHDPLPQATPHILLQCVQIGARKSFSVLLKAFLATSAVPVNQSERGTSNQRLTDMEISVLSCTPLRRLL
jgi:hypothetical protein